MASRMSNLTSQSRTSRRPYSKSIKTKSSVTSDHQSSPDRYILHSDRATYHKQLCAGTQITPTTSAREVEVFNVELGVILGWTPGDRNILRTVPRYGVPRNISFRTTQKQRIEPSAPIEIRPHKILDAPMLSDDFYTSNLAWSSAGQLAVALGHDVHLWSAKTGQKHVPGMYMDPLTGTPKVYATVTALAYSANNRWLAVARKDGLLQAYSKCSTTSDAEYRLNGDVACMMFRPQPQSLSSVDELLVGAHDGTLILLAIRSAYRAGLRPIVFQVLQIIPNAHTEQVTGLSWSPDGAFFASGGNDNLTCVFAIDQPRTPRLRFRHKAAVKALSFCPWQPNLLAAGSGSHDRTIKFFDVKRVCLLETLDLSAQITSISWSSRYKEFAVTLGYALGTDAAKVKGVHRECQHERCIADAQVYTWPGLRCIIASPLPRHNNLESRAIYAAPSLERDRFGRVVTSDQLIVASSDETVRFYKLFGTDRAVEHRGIGLGGGRVLADHDLPMASQSVIR